MIFFEQKKLKKSIFEEIKIRKNYNFFCNLQNSKFSINLKKYFFVDNRDFFKNIKKFRFNKNSEISIFFQKIKRKRSELIENFDFLQKLQKN